MSALSNISANICVTDMQVRLIEAHLEASRKNACKIDEMLAELNRQDDRLDEIQSKMEEL